MESMTCANIVAGFRVTGVFPINRNVVKLPGESAAAKILEKCDLPYIPLFTPAKRRIRTSHSILSEEDSFSYSLLSESPLPSSAHVHPSIRQNSLVNIAKLNVDIPKLTLAVPQKASERVLTSEENLRRLEEKIKMREDDLLKKQQKILREKSQKLKVKSKGE